MTLFGKIWSVVQISVIRWNTDHIPRRAAALAFYAGFSLAPLLLISIAVASVVVGAEAVRGHVLDQLRRFLGKEAAHAVETVLANTRMSHTSVSATVFGLATLAVAASGVFGELQDSLNAIWRVSKKSDRGLKGLVRDRFLSYSLVVGTGFLLIVSLLVSAMLEALLGEAQASARSPQAIRIENMGISFLVITLLFALIFKVVPDALTRWRDIWLGASITSILFTIGKWLIGLYLGHNALASSYGAAGSLVVLFLWLYYSCQVFLMGAELTFAYAQIFGQVPVPTAQAEPLPARDLAPSGGSGSQHRRI